MSDGAVRFWWRYDQNQIKNTSLENAELLNHLMTEANLSYQVNDLMDQVVVVISHRRALKYFCFENFSNKFPSASKT